MTESSHLGDSRYKEMETQQTERQEYEQGADRCGILRPKRNFGGGMLRMRIRLMLVLCACVVMYDISRRAYITTHAHKTSISLMRMRNMPPPKITLEIFVFVHGLEIPRNLYKISNLVRFFWEWRTPRASQVDGVAKFDSYIRGYHAYTR